MTRSIPSEPDTYPEVINFLGKAITLRSSDGAADTIIDGDGLFDSVVKCISGEGADTVLDGFTITRGATGPFGGMHNLNSSPTVTDCTFSENSANTDGGGMVNFSSNPVLIDCVFSENTADFGGGMSNYDSNVTLSNCTFSENTADFGGGMLNGVGSSTTVTNSTFRDNSAVTSGGGMYNTNSADVVVTNSIFSANTAGKGGGMDNDNSPMVTVTNCTFSLFSAEVGGGMANLLSSPTVTNCIFWGNDPDEFFGSGTPTVTYSDVQGSFVGMGILDVDPLLVDPDGTDNIIGTADDNLRLSPGSPCIDAADNTAVPLDVTDLDGDMDTSERTPFDRDGGPRFVDDLGTADTGADYLPDYPSVVDMGAYELIVDCQDVADAAIVTLGPGEGTCDTTMGPPTGCDPMADALAEITRCCEPQCSGCACGGAVEPICATETPGDLHPDARGSNPLGTTLVVDSNLADGCFEMTLSVPFSEGDLPAGVLGTEVDLTYYPEVPPSWILAECGNTQTGTACDCGGEPCGTRWEGTVAPAPTLETLHNRALGDYGVYWDDTAGLGFAWANVDHMTDFAPGIPLSAVGDPIPTLSEWGVIVMTLLLLTAGTIAFARSRKMAV